MFNFTGSPRRPRKVNLSGRKTNTPSQTAREERAAREAERKRLKAAGTIQRAWRGRKAAEQQRKEWRAVWDGYPADGSDVPTRISLFLAFMELGRKCQPRTWSQEDLRRLGEMLLIVCAWLSDDSDKNCDLQRRRYLLRMLGRLFVEGISSGVVKDETLELSLSILPSLTRNIPEFVDERYYVALSKQTTSSGLHDSLLQSLVEAVVVPLRVPLRPGRTDTEADADAAYRAFNVNYLTTPDLVSLLGERATEKLIAGVDLRKVTKFFSLNLETESKLWLLSHVIYFSRHKKEVVDPTTVGLLADREEYIKFLSMALSSVVVEVGQRIDVEDVAMGDGDGSDDEDGISSKRPRVKRQPLPPFVKQQIESLVQQSSITSLLSNTKSTDGNVDILAGFALTLLLIFPARRTDMRFWLCVALTADGAPAVKYVWNAMKKCWLFASIKRDSHAAVKPLKRRPAPPKGMSAKDIEDQWNLIFLFLEMYSFILVTGDDHEFLQGKGRQLQLNEVKELTLFLKNLSFATYWWYPDIMDDHQAKDTGGEEFSNVQESGRAWDMNYFRSVVTDVLKAIYARDSRRHFLPKDFWLMGKHLPLDGFITAVFREEENRRQHPEAETDEEGDEDYLMGRDSRAAIDPAARHHAEYTRREKGQKKKQRAGIGPRSTLQNLPFMIPFEKRVEIFREFVVNDQKKRRNGHTDPDLWRFSMMNGSGVEGDRLSKHKATIRRKHEFQDAYDAFWKLGEGLKEPIQIKFMDRFGAEEAGIDGGGVTKEFLTGVCGEAFSPVTDIPDNNNDPEDPEDADHYEGIPLTLLGVKNMFKENPEHLLYPNPTMLEEVKHKLGEFHISDIQSAITDILHRYEFCGRILGKCLYEGILVDLSFAPFFLLKWSQPSTASAVGVNDLRDLDAEMYRHLMALMDFEGDVESTFNLDFTINTQIAPGKMETYNLKPNGDSIPVTNANRLEYVHLISKHRLVKEPAIQTAAFLKGLTTIIDPYWLKMFNQSELQKLVGGDTGSPIDVEDLRRNTIYGGVYSIGHDGEEHETIKLFWQVMHGLDDSDRRKVLRFVTSVARAPLLGFRVLRPRFSIRDAGDDQTRLCSASTCVNLLKLPRYKDVRTLRKKLLYSVRSNAGFDLS